MSDAKLAFRSPKVGIAGVTACADARQAGHRLALIEGASVEGQLDGSRARRAVTGPFRSPKSPAMQSQWDPTDFDDGAYASE